MEGVCESVEVCEGAWRWVRRYECEGVCEGKDVKMRGHKCVRGCEGDVRGMSV